MLVHGLAANGKEVDGLLLLANKEALRLALFENDCQDQECIRYKC